MATAEEYEKMSASEKKKEDWMNAKWRPMMGWIYMITCITDFIIFPVLWSMLQAAMKQPITPWNPITLQGAGLFHLSMGAIIGIAAFGRTQEKLAGANNGGIQTPSAGPSAFGAPSAGGFSSASSFGNAVPSSIGGGGFGSTSNQGFQQPPAGSFGAAGGGFNAAPVAVAGLGAAAAASVPFVSNEVILGPGGKPAPVQPPDPEI